MKKIIIPVASFAAIILSGMLLYSCSNSSAEKTAAATSNNEGPVVDAFVLSQGSLSDSVRIPGELTAYQDVAIYAKINSFVKKLYVDVGSEVKAGQLLAVMEAPELNAQQSGAESRVKSQKAIYLSSKATYDRLLETSKTPGTVSKNDLDIADAKQKSDYAQYQAAQSALKEVTDNRNYLEIRAPFGGVISARNVSAGAYVGPAGKGSDMPIFTLEEQKNLRLVVNVPENMGGNLDQNSDVVFTVNSMPGKTFHGKIARMSGALDSKLRSQHIEVDVDNSDKKLLPGMVTEVFLPVSANKNGFIISNSALLNSTQGVFVVKVENGKTIWVPVNTGLVTDDKVEIFGNLSKGDTLITTVSEEVRNGNALNGKLAIATQ